MLYKVALALMGDAARRSQLGVTAGYRARFVFICVYRKWIYVCVRVFCRTHYMSLTWGDVSVLRRVIAPFSMLFVYADTLTHTHSDTHTHTHTCASIS